MFVDDSLFVVTALIIKCVMAASSEALYIVLGFPNLTSRQSPLSLDKYPQSVCSYERIQLGKFINSRSMNFGITKPKHLAMIQELVHWHDHRKEFTLLQGVTLCDNFKDYGQTLVPGVDFFSCLYVTLSRQFLIRQHASPSTARSPS